MEYKAPFLIMISMEILICTCYATLLSAIVAMRQDLKWSMGKPHPMTSYLETMAI